MWLVLLLEIQLELPLEAQLELPLEVQFELPLEELPELPLQLPLEYEKQDLHPTALFQMVDFVVEWEGAVGHLGEDHSQRVG